MISQEARDLFAANVKAMTAGDAAHLASQVLPDDVSRLKDIAYVNDGDAAHLLDIYTPADAEEGAALPVIVDFHGGGLYYGNKENNECRDMLLAPQGFAVVNTNYRLVPAVSFPAQLADAMAVLDWVRDHGAEYGLDAERVCVTGDSAGGLGLRQFGIDVHALVVTSGMFRLQGGVHANALSYYMEGYLQTPADHIKVNPYLDLDKLIVDGDVPPIYMITSVEDFIADNTYELARILHARHKDHAMSVWPKGRERVLGHVFNIVQAGDPEAGEAHQVICDIADYCKRYI